MLYFSRWKTAAILGTTLIVCLPALTNVLPAATFDSLPGWAQRKIELGIDLRGGGYYQFAIDADDVRKQMVERLRDDLRAFLREERIGYTGMTVLGDTVEVRVRDVWDMPRAMRRIDELADPKFQAMGPAFPSTANVTLPTGAPRLTAAPGELSPVPRIAAAIEGQLLRLKVTEFAVSERIAEQQRRLIPMAERRFLGRGAKFSIRPVGTDRIVVETSITDHRRLHLLFY